MRTVTAGATEPSRSEIWQIITREWNSVTDLSGIRMPRESLIGSSSNGGSGRDGARSTIREVRTVDVAAIKTISRKHESSFLNRAAVSSTSITWGTSIRFALCRTR